MFAVSLTAKALATVKAAHTFQMLKSFRDRPEGVAVVRKITALPPRIALVSASEMKEKFPGVGFL